MPSTFKLWSRDKKIEGTLTNDAGAYHFGLEGGPTPIAKVQLIVDDRPLPRGEWSLRLRLTPGGEWIDVDIYGEDEWSDMKVRLKPRNR